MKIFLISFLTCACSLSTVAAEPVARKVIDTKGRAMDVTLLSVVGKSVKVRRTTDGAEVDIPLEMLSKADRDFIAQWYAKKQPSLSISPRARPVGADPANLALGDARKFARLGEYPKALERHEWFHANALKTNPALKGVRLSYALSDWVELGGNYAPALESLKQLRAQAEQAVLAGKGNMDQLSEIGAINRALGKIDPTAAAHTITVFKQLDLRFPKQAQTWFPRVEEDLMKANEIALFTKYAGNLTSYMDSEIESLQKEIEQLIADQPKDKNYRAFLLRKFEEKSLFLVKCAESTGHKNLPSELEKLAKLAKEKLAQMDTAPSKQPQ